MSAEEGNDNWTLSVNEKKAMEHPLMALF